MDTDRSANPTLAAVRLARAQRDAVMRRLRPVSLVILALVLVIGSASSRIPACTASRWRS